MKKDGKLKDDLLLQHFRHHQLHWCLKYRSFCVLKIKTHQIDLFLGCEG